MTGGSLMDTAAAGTGPAPGGAIRTGTAPPLAGRFTPRPESVPGLAAALVPEAAVALVPADVGQPGQRVGSCGKTQLAAHLAHQLWRSGEVKLLAWVDASSRASLLAGYLEAAAAVGIGLAGPAEQVARRFSGWLAATTRPWLMVLDDLRDPADLDGLWPAGPAGRVLITTPDEQTVAAESGAARAVVVPVGGLSTREAIDYLMGRLAGDPDQRHGAIDLTATLGGDPCALAQASALIATTTGSCRDYQHHYASTRERLAARQPGSEPPAAPAVTWMLSVERAGQLCPGGAPLLLLGLAALLGGHPVPGPVFATAATCTYLAEAGVPAADGDSAWEGLRALERTGLLTIDPAGTPPAFWLNGGVAAQARAAMPGPMLERAAQTAADALVEVWPRHEPLPWLASDLRSCAAALAQAVGDRLWAGQRPHPLLLKAGHSTSNAALTGPAAGYWAQLTATSDRILGPDNPATLAAGRRLAEALLAAGQAPEAAAWCQWVAAGRTRTLGPDHPGTLAARVSLGHAMTAAGQASAAVTVLEQATAACERALGLDRPHTLHARDELAAACQAAGKPGDAIRHYRHGLAERERVHGARDPATMTGRENLARACLADGRIKEAISVYKRVLADRERVLGAGHLDTIASRRSLSTGYHAAGKIAAALQLHEQVCDGYEQALGPHHPETLACRADLANAYHAAGRLTDAATLLRDTLARCEQALPAGDPLTQNLRHTISGTAAG